MDRRSVPWCVCQTTRRGHCLFVPGLPWIGLGGLFVCGYSGKGLDDGSSSHRSAASPSRDSAAVVPPHAPGRLGLLTKQAPASWTPGLVSFLQAGDGWRLEGSGVCRRE